MGGERGERRDTSGLTTRLILEYVRDQAGDAAVEAVLTEAGETRPVPVLLDEGSWSTYEQRVRLLQGAAAVLGDREAPRAIGASALRLHVGQPVIRLAQYLGSPSVLARNVARLAAKVSTCESIEPVEVGHDHAVIDYRLDPGLHPSEANCRYSAGLLSLMGPLFGLPPAAVDHPSCQARGDDRCRYVVRWRRRSRLPWRRPRPVSTGEHPGLPALAELVADIDAVQGNVAALIATGDAEGLLSVTASLARRAVGGDRSLVAVRPEDGAPLVVLADGFDERQAGEVADRLLAGDDPGLPGGSLVARVASELRDYGVLACFSARDAFFSEENALLAGYARTAASALDAAAVLRRAQRERETSTALLALARDLAGLGEPREIAQRIAAAVPKVIEADASAVIALDDEARVLRVEGLWGWPGELATAVSGFELALDASPLIDRVLDEPAPVYVTPEIEDPVVTAVLTEFETNAALVVPIVVRGDVIGLVAAVKRGPAPESLAPDLTARLQGLADEAATALDNARLYEAQQRQLTAMAESEAGLLEARNALSHLLESAPVITFRGTTRDFAARYVSQNVRELFGYEPADFLEGRWREFVHPDDRAAVAKEIQRVLSEPQVEFEARFRAADGQYRWSRVHLRCDMDQPPEEREILGYIWDETERREAEERYRRVSDITSDVAYAYRITADGSAVVEWGTEGFQRIAGYTPEEAIRLGGWLGLVIPEDLPSYDAHQRAVRGGTASTGEFRIRTRSGDIRWLEIVDKPIPGPGEGELRVFGAVRDVTERRAAQRTLAEREAQLREAQALAQVGNWRIDPAMNLLDWSDEMARMFGWPGGRPAPGADWVVEHIHPEDRDDLFNAVTRALATGEIAEHEYRIIRPDGVLRWMHMRCEAELGVDGNPVAFRGTTQDVTERHEAEEYRRVITDAVSDAAFAFRVAGTRLVLEWVSDAWARLTGYDVTPMPTELFRPIAHEDDLGVMADAEARVLRGERTVDEFRVRAADGSLRWLRIYAIPVRDDVTGEVVRVYGAAQDVTERRRAEEALAQSEAHFRRLIEASPLAVVVFERGGRVSLMNPAAEELFGYTLDETKAYDGPPPWVDPEHAAEFDDLTRRLAVGERITGYETRRRHRDGTMIDVAVSLAALDRGPGQPGSALAVLADISERVRLEEELRQAQKMNAIGRLAGGIAHDFNNILTTVLGHAEFLLEEATDEAAVLEHADAIRLAGERAAALTEQMLMLSRHRPPVAEILDLNEEVAAMRDMLSRLIGEHIEFQVRVAPEPCIVRMARSHVQQVLLNMVVNARDAMPDGGQIMVDTATTDGGDGTPVAVLRVSDTGEGMDAETRERIFEPFFTTKESGVGLGLSVVYGIVDGVRGEISVTSSPGEGTTFETRFPAAVGVVVPEAVPERTRARTNRYGSVLLVEDEDEVRAVAAAALRRRRFTVTEARDALEALTLVDAGQQRVDLLVTDLVMPHMSGGELAERLRARWPGLRVLYMSGYSEVVPEAASESGAASFLQKPFTPDALLDAVRRLLEEEVPSRS